jgi:hypothetical protein
VVLLYLHLNIKYKDYLADRKSGIYWPVLPPTYQKKYNDTNDKKIDSFTVMKDEILRQCVRKGAGFL